jgi:hypothetical protein
MSLGDKSEQLDEATVFEGPVDFRGLSYEHIYVETLLLFPWLRPFDRQPYSQMENCFRKGGDDQRANQVYLERRRVERENKLQPSTILMWLLDWVYKLVANYGIRPLRLIALSLVLIVFGGGFFAQPGALEAAHKKPGDDPVLSTPPARGDEGQHSQFSSYGCACGIGLASQRAFDPGSDQCGREALRVS